MQKKALLKTSFREIFQYKTRFLSIMGIIFLGVMVFVGLKATGPNMIQTANNYYQKYKLPDVSLVSTLGFSQKEINQIQKENEVARLYPRYTKDMTIANKNLVIKFISYDLSKPSTLSTYKITAGRLPKKSSEIALDEAAKKQKKYKLGDILTLSDEDNREHVLKKTKYKVVGFVQSPTYIENMARGNTTIGKGALDFFAVIPKNDMNLSAYTEVLIDLKGLKNKNTYSNDYKKHLDKEIKQLKQELRYQPEQRANELYKTAQSNIDKAEKSIKKTQEKLINGENSLNEYKQQLIRQQQQLTAIQNGQTTIPSMLDPTQLIEMQQALITKQEAYKKQVVTFNQEKIQTQQRIVQAQKQVEQARKKAERIKPATYYYFTREDNPGFTEYKDNANRMASLSTIFPLFFFLIAILVSLTTMTRMVEEKRIEVGSLKALGYHNGEIAFKFLFYATTASLVGAILGLIIGYYLFPTIIFNAYGQLYNLSGFVTPWYLSYSLVALLLAVLCTAGAALVVLRIDLFSPPAALLLPKAPKAGKRILLEKWSFLWRKLSFMEKVTARNLFRYKLRMWMTILGIAGCMSLIVTGFGLKDSISDIAQIQFNKLLHYQAVITYKENLSNKEMNRNQSLLNKSVGIKKTLSLVSENLKTVSHVNHQQDVTLYVPEEINDLKPFVLFNNRKTGKKYQLPKDGVIIDEKLANLFRYQVGDQLLLKNETNDREYKMTIKHIVENYTGHFVYMAPKYYEKVFNQKPKYNTAFLLFNHSPTEKVRNTFGNRTLKQSNVLDVTFLSSTSDALNDTIHSLNIVVWVLIVVSGLLSFIVLYNLTNINISERIRELSTIKVLGFYDNEITMYVYRENIILTVIGILLGCFLGKILHGYVLSTVEIDILMFSPFIHWQSYLYLACITLFFAFMVMVIMYKKLKKIDMIAALKSNDA